MSTSSNLINGSARLAPQLGLTTNDTGDEVLYA